MSKWTRPKRVTKIRFFLQRDEQYIKLSYNFQCHGYKKKSPSVEMNNNLQQIIAKHSKPAKCERENSFVRDICNEKVRTHFLKLYQICLNGKSGIWKCHPIFE